MKIYLSLILTFIGSAYSTFGTGFSESTNGIYIAVESWGKESMRPITNEPFASGDQLFFMGFCNTGRVELQYPPDPAYCIKIRMVSQDGTEIPKTRMGKMFGSEFDELHTLDPAHANTLLAEGSHEQNRDVRRAKPLPSPQQLFEIKKSGIYTMEIQMQMFLVHKNINPWTRELIRFSPIKIKIVKPPE